MKRKLALVALLCLGLTNAFGQGMGQPGFYGRIEIGSYGEQPPLLFPNAVMGNPGVFTGSPIYMHVPPQHAYYWSSYCGLYGACNWMVYFVQPSWYEQVYVPGFRSGVFAYAPPPVYVAPPIYVHRPYPHPYYGYHHHHHDHDRPRPSPHWGDNDGRRHDRGQVDNGHHGGHGNRGPERR